MTASLESLIERFCRYVKIDTQAQENAGTYPSSPGQMELGRILASELRSMGLGDAAMDDHGIVMATIPATARARTPTIAWVAHVDTSPETSGRGVKPIVHRNYQGGDIVLPGDSNRVLRPAEIPDLSSVKGHTLITSDGTTLLGSDDKSGVTVIMEAAAQLLARPEISHGPIRICFTCDEEVGHGVDHIDLKKLGALVAYTLDGGGVGEIDVETFSADLAIVKVTGVNTHPSVGKGKMVNAIRLAAAFIDRLPVAGLSPETTAEREGFLHPYRVEGGVAEASIRILLRDFDTDRLAQQAQLLRSVAGLIMAEYPRSRVEVSVSPQYRNMADGLAKEPRAVSFAEEAMRAAGIEPKRTMIRGGTDGSRLTELGLPTPNLSTGEHGIHSPLEWTSAEEMAIAVRVLVELARRWGAAT
jgi:tripeptide aminopeptidase